ncbi:MAG: NADH-quinone oxidoreductase subunit C, partial [bacterium]
LGGDHRPADDKLIVIYHLYSMSQDHWIILKVFLNENEPVIPSMTDLYRTADWHERETYDMLGIRFRNHPDLRRLLLPEDWHGHPLRKDYQFPEEYRGLPVNWSDARKARMSRDDFYEEAVELEEMDIDPDIGFPAGTPPENGDNGQ